MPVVCRARAFMLELLYHVARIGDSLAELGSNCPAKLWLGRPSQCTQWHNMQNGNADIGDGQPSLQLTSQTGCPQMTPRWTLWEHGLCRCIRARVCRAQDDQEQCTHVQLSSREEKAMLPAVAVAFKATQ